MPDDSLSNSGIREISVGAEDPTAGKHAGGTHTHKPDCRCYPCKARRRKEEAIAQPAGARRADVAPAKAGETKANDVIEADEDQVFVTHPVSHIGKGESRTRIAYWVGQRATKPGITIREVAAQLGIGEKSLQRDIIKAKREGCLLFEDPLSRIEYGIIPKVIDNLEAFLDAKDRTVTIEAAKGTVFPMFKEYKGITDNQTTMLAIKIEAPKEGEDRIITGEILGKPKQLEEKHEL